jgi:hypothetical protein
VAVSLKWYDKQQTNQSAKKILANIVLVDANYVITVVSLLRAEAKANKMMTSYKFRSHEIGVSFDWTARHLRNVSSKCKKDFAIYKSQQPWVWESELFCDDGLSFAASTRFQPSYPYHKIFSFVVRKRQ